MRKILIIFFIFLFSLTILSCGEKEEYENWEKKGYTPLSSPSDLTASGASALVTCLALRQNGSKTKKINRGMICLLRIIINSAGII